MLHHSAANHYLGNLQHVQAPKLTNRVSVVTPLGCQSSTCVIDSMRNILSNWLVFLKIETNLYSSYIRDIVLFT